MNPLTHSPLTLGLALAGALVCLACRIGAAEEQKVAIEYREKVTAFFSEAKAELHFDVTATEAIAGKIAWTLGAKGRILASGEVEARPTPDVPSTLTIDRTLPPLREGVALALQLKVAFQPTDSKERMAEVVHDLWLFSHNPFVDRKERLEELDIKVFDPAGESADALEKLEVPFKHVHIADALHDVSEGTLVIGEGTSLKDYPSLSKLLPALAARGVHVICLAPSDGELVLPLDANNEERRASQFSLRRIDLVAQLDKRLSSPRWVVDQKVELRTIKVSSTDEHVTGEIVDQGQGWPWLEVKYDRPHGRFVFCGFGLLKAWEQSPVPRYLLAKLLETLP